MALTRVVNTGDDRFIGYLPPHGRFMASGSHFVMDGDLRSILAGGRGRYSRKTELDSLDSDITNGDIHLTDEEDGSSSN